MSSPQSSVWKDAPAPGTVIVPALLCDSDKLWLAYRSYKGYAIVRFADVIDHRLSPINDQGLRDHLYFKAGLEAYAFNEVTGSQETVEWAALKARHWVVTFQDNTLDVVGSDAKVVATDLQASSPTAALLSFLHHEAA